MYGYSVFWTDVMPYEGDDRNRDTRYAFTFDDALKCALGEDSPFKNAVVKAMRESNGELTLKDLYNTKTTGEIVPGVSIEINGRGFGNKEPKWHVRSNRDVYTHAVARTPQECFLRLRKLCRRPIEDMERLMLCRMEPLELIKLGATYGEIDILKYLGSAVADYILSHRLEPVEIGEFTVYLEINDDE